MNNLITKLLKSVRKVWIINPVTRFKKGNKKKRRRDKFKTRNELRKYQG